VITGEGSFCYPDQDGNLEDLEIRIGVYQFTNPSGLDSVGSSMYKESDASGYAMEETAFTELKKSTIVQGRLEASNVQVADEMVNLIVAQRAYEMNSKAIQTADDMLSLANQLKR
jgi:flagellar basal-body rod protein FlgG